AGRDWQVSIIIWECSAGEYTDVVGDPAPPALATEWFCCLTPDGDILVHLLAVGALAGVVVLDKMGQPTDSTSEGQKARRRHSVCGADREAMALDYVAALRFCRPEALSSGHPSRRLRGKQLRPASGTPSGDGAAKVPTDMEVSEGALPTPPDGHCGEILAATGSDTARMEPFGGATDGYAVAGGFGVVPMGSEAHVVRGVKRDELGGDGDLDARSFSIKVVFEGERCRPTKDAVNLLSEASWPVRPVLGPHTTRWCLPILADQGAHPRARHTRWGHEAGVSSDDPGVSDHELCMRVLGLGMPFDQLDGGELGFFEYIARRAQLIEHRYRERAMDRPDGFDGAEDDYLMMGTLETRGHSKIAPELKDCITAELHREAGVLEERRELREERAISSRGGGGGCAGSAGDDKGSLQQKIQQQAAELKRFQPTGAARRPGRPGACPAGSLAGMVVARELLPINLAALSAPREPPGAGRCGRSVRSRALRRTLVDERVRESVTALNLLYNHGEAQVSHQLSLAQVRGVEHLRRGWERLGAPEVSPAAACSELCGSMPGYGDPVKTAPYQRDLVSLPTGGVLAEGGRCLGGAALSFWKEWRQHLLRPGVSREVVQKFRPHVDSRLRAKGTYAQFVLDLQAAGLVNLRGRLDATLGVFFVWKSDGVRQRLIFDIRGSNEFFNSHEYSQLPTASAWNSLYVPDQCELSLCQADVDNAFYRIGLPAGIEDYFVLPPVSCRHLEALCPGSSGELRGAGELSPVLRVLPMGWSWSLYFCQCMVEQAVLDSGLPPSRLVQDRRAAAGLEEGPLAAVYVDGVAFLGASEKCCSDGCASAVELLGSRGLICKGMVGASEQQSFTGLTFERSSGIISLSTRRLWKIRLGLLELCRQGWCTGVQLRRVLGHLTWAFLLKRELLSILSSAFRFCEMAGEQRWRLWSCVTRELRIAAALLPFAAVDTKRPFDPCAMASDASGATEFDFGGFGVCERAWDSEAVRAVASRAERWRYCVEDAICAREQSLGLVPQGPSKPRSSQVRARRGVTDFFHIDGGQIGDFDTWRDPRGPAFHDAPAAWVRPGGAAGTSPSASAAFDRELERTIVQRARGQLAAPLGLCGLGGGLDPELVHLVQSLGQSWFGEPPQLLQLEADASRAAAEGLTLPQTSRAGHGAQLQYQRSYTDFLGRSRGGKLRMSTVANLARGLASYLDRLFFDGRTRGFFAIIGAGVCCGLLDCCLGLLVVWGAHLRLASASIGVRGGSQVAPARRSRIDRWAIFLFPEELPDRSKTGQFEEGMVLESDAVQCVSSALNALKLRSQADRPLWPSSSPRFRQDFAACASLEGLEDVPPYQDRHGADSHDVLFQVGEFGAVQEKSRHLNESSTRRCRKGTRYLATDEKLSPEIKAFGEW
ncbi:unnamed protein product, partial [Prorocentrum cordatum]